MADMTDEAMLINALECSLFAAKEPVPLAQLAEVLGIDATELPGLLERLTQAREGSGLQVVQLAGGYSLGTRAEYAEYVERLLQPDPAKLSIQALETLAIVAYRQPITRPEVDEVRGVNSTGAVMSLVAKDLVRVAGRKDAPGRPFVLETTPHFLSSFGLKDLGDLPDISELRRAMESRMAPDETLALEE
jgi:segregation and condensation protein B